MSELQGLTLTQIESQVARNILGIDFVSRNMSSNGSTTTMVDNTLSGGVDSWNGAWVILDSGDNADSEREITDDDGSGTLTFAPAVANATASGDTYKLFGRDGRYRSNLIRNVINDAITYVVGKWVKTEESVALHGDGTQSRFDLPSEFDGLSDVLYRRGHGDREIHGCDTVFSTVTDSDITQAVDSEDAKRGSSLKLTIAATVSDGDVIGQEITQGDLSGYTHLEGWCKATTALAAADFAVQLRETTATTRETLSVPAISADTWTFFRVALANPELDTAIDHVYLEYNANSGANTVWFDDLRVIDDNSGNWIPINHRCWYLDHEAADLILKPSGVGAVGYSLMKLKGGSNPTTMSSGSTTATAPEEYLVAKATGELLLMYAKEDVEFKRANVWLLRAEEAKRKLRLPVNYRRLRA